METAERFWSKVDKSTGDCWLWRGGKDNSGFARCYAGNGKQLSARKVAWEIEYGSLPPGANLLPTCDVRLCVRPAHMKPASRGDLMRQAYKDARGNERHRKRTVTRALNNDQEREIIRRYAEGNGSHLSLSREFGVSKSTIFRILQRRTQVAV